MTNIREKELEGIAGGRTRSDLNDGDLDDNTGGGGNIGREYEEIPGDTDKKSKVE